MLDTTFSWSNEATFDWIGRHYIMRSLHCIFWFRLLTSWLLLSIPEIREEVPKGVQRNAKSITSNTIRICMVSRAQRFPIRHQKGTHHSFKINRPHRHFDSTSSLSLLLRQGILLLEELVQTHSEGNRDYIYYLAIGNARIKEYSVALKFCKAFLQIEPNNQQAITLEVSLSSLGCLWAQMGRTINIFNFALQ